MKKAIVTALMTLPLALPVRAADKVLLEVPIVYSEGTKVKARLKDECAIEKDLENRIGALLAKRNKDGSSLLPPDMDSHGIAVLQVQITLATGSGGGAMTGNKTLTVRATKLEGGKILQRKRFSGASNGGFLGGFKDTCSIFSRIADKLADDIVPWVYENHSEVDQAIKPVDKVSEPSAVDAN